MRCWRCCYRRFCMYFSNGFALHDFVYDQVHIPGPENQAEIVGAKLVLKGCGHILKLRQPHHSYVGIGFSSRVGDKLASYPRQRHFIGSVDVADHETIHASERRAEILPEVLGAAVAVRLEHADDPLGFQLSGRSYGSRDFSGVVGVIVNERSALPGASELEPARHARETLQRIG